MADVMALCAGIRPVVMVDYGGKLPELQQHLCALLRFCHKVWSSVPMFSTLRKFANLPNSLWSLRHWLLNA